jgi:ABC-type transporter Mla maintaining outer membrane lipid asymmetry ATPase subunit MlaF
MVRKAYKTAQPAINATIDEMLLESFCIGDVWEMATEDQAQERKDEWNDAKKKFIKSFTHGMKRRQALARSIMLNPDEAGGVVG